MSQLQYQSKFSFSSLTQPLKRLFKQSYQPLQTAERQTFKPRTYFAPVQKTVQTRQCIKEPLVVEVQKQKYVPLPYRVPTGMILDKGSGQMKTIYQRVDVVQIVIEQFIGFSRKIFLEMLKGRNAKEMAIVQKLKDLAISVAIQTFKKYIEVYVTENHPELAKILIPLKDCIEKLLEAKQLLKQLQEIVQIHMKKYEDERSAVILARIQISLDEINKCLPKLQSAAAVPPPPPPPRWPFSMCQLI